MANRYIMETITIQTKWARPELMKARAETADEAYPVRRARLAWFTIVVLAACLRFWNIDAIFESSDQAAMANMIHHNFGLRWIFAHDYGPTLPVLQRSFSTLCCLLGIPASEWTCRFPVALVSLAQILISYPFLRRLGAGGREAFFATLCAALLPTLVSDGHYAWGYLTVWLFTGTIALWATVSWLDERRPVQLAVAGVALFLHCLSNVFAFGLPIVLLLFWIVNLRFDAVIRKGNNEQPNGSAWKLRHLGAPVVGFVLPCLAALFVIFISWWWTGGGQIGRLLAKQNHGALAGRLNQIWELPAFWCTQFGYVFGLIAAVGLVWGIAQLRYPSSRRLGLLAIWAVVAAFPLVILTDWSAVGYPGSYFIEVIYCAGLLGGVFMWRLFERLSTGLVSRAVTLAVAVVVVAVLGMGTADECLLGGRWSGLTGVRTGWGNVRQDTGIKAAGWYVRRYVPVEAVVMSLHANDGMEVTVAEYYCGRRIIAHYDILPAMIAPLLEEMKGHVDAVIVDNEREPLVSKLPDFEPVCRLFNQDWPVRMIYARKDLALPRVCTDIARINPVYDHLYTPRRVPVPLSAAPSFLEELARYQTAVKHLKATRNADRRP